MPEPAHKRLHGAAARPVIEAHDLLLLWCWCTFCKTAAYAAVATQSQMRTEYGVPNMQQVAPLQRHSSRNKDSH